MQCSIGRVLKCRRRAAGWKADAAEREMCIRDSVYYGGFIGAVLFVLMTAKLVGAPVWSCLLYTSICPALRMFMCRRHRSANST